jgi:hypothetical protein
MRKNKYFAAFMAVLAVAVVHYQFVLRPAPEAKRPAVNPPPPAAPSPRPEPGSASDRSLIDMNADALLKRVYDSPVFEIVDQELPGEFGTAIFTRGELPAGSPAGGSESTSGPGLVLTGTVLDGDRRLAIINQQIVQEGDFIGGAEVVAIRPRQADLRQGGRSFRLTTESTDVKIEWIEATREK